MKTKRAFLTVFFIAICAIQYSFSQETAYSLKWSNGFKLESADKNFKLKFGGRLMIDHALFMQDAAMDLAFGDLETRNGTEFRRARFFSSGTVYKHVAYKLQLDFVGGKVGMKDAYIRLKKIPGIGSITIGNFKEPFRFDALISSKYTTFMERALILDFSQIRNNGIMLASDYLNKRLSVQVGFFRDSDGTGDDKIANDGYALTGRFTGLPIRTENLLLHLGAGFSFRTPDSGEYKLASRPEAHLSGIKYISTGNISNVEHITLVDFEGLFIRGSFSLQAEYLNASVKTTSETLNFSSYYAQLSYFLTGEGNKYKSSYDGIDRLKPKNNFGYGKGLGAWELALRYTHSNLNNLSVEGGEQTDISFGINWYLNPTTKVMFNEIIANVKDAGRVNILQMRVQIDF